jgi:multidrug resistance protein
MIAALVTLATFVDIVAYSICVPVLPDLAARMGASATTIGMLFASFGVTLLLVPIPAGALSDRTGRRVPMVFGLALLAIASAAFGAGGNLPTLFGARLLQGAADAITWVIGFALLADAYDPGERGRMTGIVMAGASFAYMIGPSLGGWLYEMGGVRLPFFALAAAAAIAAVLFAIVDLPARHEPRDRVPAGAIVREPAVLACTVAVVGIGTTLAMFEPVVALHLETHVGLTPARVGLVFVPAALANMGLHPLFGRLADRWGARRLTLAGLALTAAVLPGTARMWSFQSAIMLSLLQTAANCVVITPSLNYMAESVSAVGLGNYGVAYGLYNMAWGAGLLVGPAAGGFLFERFGFEGLAWIWAPALALVPLLLTRVQSPRAPREEPA